MKKLLVIFSLVLISNGIWAQNTWEKKAFFAGQKRDRAVAFSIGDYGYVATGEDTVNMTHNDLWRYDPVTDSWTQMANLPGSTRRNAVGVTIGDKGYVGLGADSSVSTAGTKLSDWWEYDTLTNGWTQKADYPGGIDFFGTVSPFGVYFATAFSIGNIGYVCCGKFGSDQYGTDLWQYNPLTDAWTRLADFPGQDRYQLSSVSIDGKGYVGLGIDHDLYRKDWYEYDPILDSWTQKASLPGVQRGSASSFTLGQRGYIVFGTDGGYKDELWEYNPFTDSWNVKANFPGKGSSGLRRNFYEYTPLEPIGIDEDEIILSIYPNPVQDKAILNVSNHEKVASYWIVDLSGKKIKTNYAQGENTVIQRGDIKAGQYFIVLTDHNQQLLSTKKIIFN
jgi:N-acetylneuraminic acid mutarotase